MSDVDTGGTALSESPDRPMVVRWVAAFALALAVLGFAFYVGGKARWPGTMVASATIVSAVMALIDLYFAPVRMNARGKRWRPRQMRVLLQGQLAVGALAMIGVPTLFLSSEFGGWTPTTGHDWQILMLAFMTILWSVPLAYPKLAGWALDGVK